MTGSFRDVGPRRDFRGADLRGADLAGASLMPVTADPGQFDACLDLASADIDCGRGH